MKIIEVTEISDELVDALHYLMPQLSSSITPPSKTDLQDIINSSASHLFIAMTDSQPRNIVGTVSLAVYRIPFGLKAWIEDMVVDENVRGQGIGTKLMNAALTRAEELGVHKVFLTSAPARLAANRLYQHLGFINITTNVYEKV
jgi:GNAT superfamily N-acetyltransferase